MQISWRGYLKLVLASRLREGHEGTPKGGGRGGVGRFLCQRYRIKAAKLRKPHTIDRE